MSDPTTDPTTDATTGTAGLPRPVARPVHPPKARPDPGPVRLALGAGGLAVLSAVAAAIILPPAASVSAAPAPPAAQRLVSHQVRYVQLAPGQTPPPGARVIDAAAPKPVTIVTKVQAPAQRPVVIRTTQSGRVLP